MSEIVVTCKIDTRPLAALKDAVEKKLAKRAMRAAVKPLIAAVRDASPTKTGGLRKSISSKVDSLKGSVNVYGVVGPRSKFIKTTKTGKKLKPSRYAAPVEKLQPFLKPSLARTQAQSVTILNQAYADEVAKMSST